MSKHKETEFADLFPKEYIRYPSKEQDMFEHWDIEVQGIKFDVKALKKINRRDSDTTNLFNFLEIKNVRGNTGWAYGDADAFAFETQNKWILVYKKDIQSLISEKVQKEWVKKSSECLYKLYRRAGRKDCITMVHNMDLVERSFKILSKEKTEQLQTKQL